MSEEKDFTRRKKPITKNEINYLLILLEGYEFPWADCLYKDLVGALKELKRRMYKKK